MTRGLDIARERPHRRPSLTPMVDVVFLLLVFFMLAARFGVDRAILLSPPGEGAGGYQGAPRLVSVTPEAVLLNGQPVAVEALGAALTPLMPEPGATVVVRPREGATLQRVVVVLEALTAAGHVDLVLAQ